MTGQVVLRAVVSRELNKRCPRRRDGEDKCSLCRQRKFWGGGSKSPIAQVLL